MQAIPKPKGRILCAEDDADSEATFQQLSATAGGKSAIAPPRGEGTRCTPVPILMCVTEY